VGNHLVIGQLYKHGFVMGEITPFSHYAIAELLEPLDNILRHRDPSDIVHILEVGAGTGSLTDQICTRLIAQKNTHLDVVEINSIFAPNLNKILQPCNGTLHVAGYPTSLHTYDIIVSTLPEQTLAPVDVTNLHSAFVSHLKPGGVLSRAQYVTKMTYFKFMFGDDRRNMIEHTALHMKRFNHMMNTTTRTVWANIPPTYIFHSTHFLELSLHSMYFSTG
jgi:phospholipid N-methyltransferase